MAGEDEVDGLTAGATPSSSTAAAAMAPRRPQHAGTVYRPSSRFSFPRAAQPEIVRAYQKDVYYRDMLRDQLQDVARSVLGSRTLFAHAETISFLGSVAYFTLSTLGGAQTLGEEYVNAMMTDGKTGRIVALRVSVPLLYPSQQSCSPPLTGLHLVTATNCVHLLPRRLALPPFESLWREPEADRGEPPAALPGAAASEATSGCRCTSAWPGGGEGQSKGASAQPARPARWNPGRETTFDGVL